MLFIYSQSHGTALTESQNRPEKKPHAEPKDEDHAEKICDEDEHFVNVEKPSDKPSILVVMHHTFNSDHVVAGSRRLVTKPNVLLTVDCLFYEGHFLKCERNNAAWDEVKKKLEVYDNQKVTLKASQTLFYIFLAGKTNGAHRDFVKKLEAVGHTETSSPEGCDYIVRFCPVASRVGTDVNAALNKIPDPAASETVKLAVSCRVAGSRWVIRPVLCGDVNGSAAGCGGGSRRAGAGESSRWSARTRVYRGLQVERTRAGENKEQKEQGASLWSRQLFISVFVVTPVLLFGPIMMADFQVPPLFVACISGSSDVSAGEPVSWNMSDQLVGNKEPPVCVKNDAGNKNCAIRPSVGKDCSEAQNKMPVLGNKFAVILAGKTNKAHRDFVKKLEAVGQTEVSSPEGCDYVVCFCPVASRVGTDVSEALDRIPADKPSILVVMHHTFNHDHVVAESRRLVTKSNVHLTLDCLFNGRHFLDCKRNDAAWDEVKKKLGVYDNEELSLSWSLLNWIGFRLLLALVLEASCCKSTTDSRNRPEKKPHAEPNDEDPDVKRSKVEEHAQTSDKDEDFVNVEKPWRTFFVVSAGKTNGAHRDFVKKLEAVGQTEASSPEGCDYVVCFCPVASRVGTDVSEALDRIPADKPSILVVMHHTFNHDHVVAESRRLVTKSNVHLTLDCLFNGRHFLDCKRNDAAWDEVKKKLGVYDNEELSLSWSLLNWIGFRLLLALVLEASCCKSTTASKSATDQAPVLKSATDQDQASESVPHQDQASESVPHQDQASESVTHQDQASESVPHQDQASK
ncbi:uncharacterized protein LOC114849476 isoform X2 [Betta splendens]|uniref:Uncharacterized protein LOC114849476 isoform X2 n=1 Tax=Betta splendens TaxID=158456 RepID=A0A9W2XL97_BETSP|nr:uncharacterized protein LOC114849476 isoform X2 [Betta splendens]